MGDQGGAALSKSMFVLTYVGSVASNEKGEKMINRLYVVFALMRSSEGHTV